MELLQLLKRDIKIISSRFYEVLNVVIFFIITCFTFSFSFSGQVDVRTASAVMMVCFMLSSNLSSRFIFEKDMESGVLQQLFLNLKSLNNLIIAKIFAQFLAFGLALCLALVVSSVFFNISSDEVILLIKIIIPTSFIISVISVMMAGITAGIKAGAIISIILSLPLYIPLIILNLSNIAAENISEFNYTNYLTTIAGFCLVIIPLSIFSVRQTIRNAVS